MKTALKTNRNLIAVIAIIFLLPIYGQSQTQRIKPPKRKSKIESVDLFVKQSFELYNNVFVYDSLTKLDAEIPSEIEDAMLELAEKNVDSLWQTLPVMFDDLANGDANLIKKGKATVNLNKSKKALKFCIKTVKAFVMGSSEKTDEVE